MIPETHQPAVNRALRAAFGTSDLEDIQPVPGGMSGALVYRIVVAARPYLLRMGAARGNPAREFAAMQLAADDGLAPRVWYASADDRVLLADFVEARPFPADTAHELAATIRRLHALPSFGEGPDWFAFVASGVERFREARLVPAAMTDELCRLYEEATRVYPRDPADRVSSHNDLKPQNMVFDGRQFWFVDWETAFPNDRYLDLALIANFWADNEGAEEAFLAAYFGEPAGDERRRRFFLMRQILHVAYAVTFLTIASHAGAPIDPDATLPAFEDLHRQIASGEASYEGAAVKVQYGLVHLRRALEGRRDARFREAVARIG